MKSLLIYININNLITTQNFETNFYNWTNNLKTTSNIINKREWYRDDQSTTKEWGKEKSSRGFYIMVDQL